MNCVPSTTCILIYISRVQNASTMLQKVKAKVYVFLRVDQAKSLQLLPCWSLEMPHMFIIELLIVAVLLSYFPLSSYNCWVDSGICEVCFSEDFENQIKIWKIAHKYLDFIA